ncbi:AAA family ATPase [Curtobacterium sp. MCBD17_040]|uniref:AAA family ATPase n=1 Tax=Curtobacterium sp. MCBD17_040 TaxID=2175674 RepID=UPI000DA74633|nr:AAA family ATPase [Curtobacterium sp. MCBD17_040]WIB64902.1 AAA family ATPase [Curtobacterium sp. MCBD17_040]
MPDLLVVTGPLAVGKDTTADALARLLRARGRTVVVVDVDDVAAMVAGGAADSGLWAAAHEAHGALVASWMRSAVDVVIAVGPVFSAEEREALTRPLPPGVTPTWVVLDAPVEVTLGRAAADATRGRSRVAAFHHEAHRRFRGLLPSIPADVLIDTSVRRPDDIAVTVLALLDQR